MSKLLDIVEGRLPRHFNGRLTKSGDAKVAGLLPTGLVGKLALPFLAGSLALGVAVIGALVTGGGSGMGGVNGFV